AWCRRHQRCRSPLPRYRDVALQVRCRLWAAGVCRRTWSPLRGRRPRGRTFQPIRMSLPSLSDHSLPMQTLDRLRVESQTAEDGLRMLSDRRNRIETRLDPRHLDRRDEHGDRPGGGCDLAPAVTFGQLRMIGDLTHVPLPGMGNLRRFEELIAGFAGQCRECSLDDSLELAQVGETMGRPIEALVGDHIGTIEDLDGEALPFAFVLDGEHDLSAITAGERSIGGDGSMGGAGPSGAGATVASEVERVAHPFDEGVEEADLQGGTFTGALPIEQ